MNQPLSWPGWGRQLTYGLVDAVPARIYSRT